MIAPNGFDPERFAPRPSTAPRFWRRALVDDPQGWRPGGDEGSSPTGPSRRRAVAGGPVLLSRRAASPRSSAWACSSAPSPARASAVERARASLVLVGGYPGEWEGEHPYDAIRATGARDVYLAGWHEHDELPDVLRRRPTSSPSPRCASSSARSLVEGMACGLPAVAVDRFGPADIVRPGHTGWLVEPDDEAALAGALAQAIDHPRSAGAAARPRAATCCALRLARAGRPAVRALRRGRGGGRRRLAVAATR